MSHREKNVVRTSRERRDCWSWTEDCQPPWREDASEPCIRVIDAGEQYVASTIFPGHESGYADGGYNRLGVWVEGKPITSAMCLPCARRWSNTRDVALANDLKAAS